MKTKSVAGIRRPCDLAGEEWAKPSTYWDVLCYKWANLKRFAYTADCKLISSFFYGLVLQRKTCKRWN